MKGKRGFTLVELMVVLGIAAILLAVSIPFGRYVRNTTTTSYLHEFATALNLARTTAITSGAQVVICRLTELNDADGNPSGIKDCQKTQTSCGSDGASNIGWQSGWVVFIDHDNDCTITHGDNSDTTTDANDNGIPDSQENDDPVIRVFAPLPNGYTLTGGTHEDVVFDSSGRALVTNNTWTLCPPDRDVSLASSVVLSRLGTVRFERTNLTCPSTP